MTATQRDLVVIAIGGNSLISARDKKSVADQYDAICATVAHIADVIESGRRVVITHGNGPQVGFILLRSEIARKNSDLHSVPLVSCVADTQGAIGWQIQQALSNELRARSDAGQVVSLVTQVRVKADDPGFADPDKFVGEFYDEKDLPALREQNPQWVLKEDPGRGWRRVVPSPAPVEIVELDAIRALLDGGFHLVTVGGGGIPVTHQGNHLKGASAVIDKDFVSELLAEDLHADYLIILTAVEKVAIHFGQADEQWLSEMTTDQARQYMAQNEFAPGSMLPKVQAAVKFAESRPGRTALITLLQKAKEGILGKTGTRIYRGARI